MVKKPDIVYFDDEEADLPGFGPADGKRIFSVKTNVESFSTVGAFSAARAVAVKANLLVFDYFFSTHGHQNSNQDDFEDNGLSAFMRWKRSLGASRPVSVLVSNHLEQALGEEVNPNRRHILALKNGVEWLAWKKPEYACELLALADASASFARKYTKVKGRHSSLNVLKQALGFPGRMSWSAVAERQLDRARPPHLRLFVDEGGSPISRQAVAREVIAWLLQKVLPYSGLLIGLNEVSARLGVEQSWLVRFLEEQPSSDLSKAIAASQYSGLLERFRGKRWWRAGVDHFIWTCSSRGQSYEAALKHASRPHMPKRLAFPNPVIVSDADLVETDQIADASECVRAIDEYFPAEVEPAWVLKEAVASDSALREKVLFEDKAEVPEPGEVQFD